MDDGVVPPSWPAVSLNYSSDKLHLSSQLPLEAWGVGGAEGGGGGREVFPKPGRISWAEARDLEAVISFWLAYGMC